MNRQHQIWRVLCLLLCVSLCGVGVPLGRAQEATPRTSPVATSDDVVSETGPVFAAGGWRVSIIAAVRAPGLNAIGLRRAEGKEWVVIVADLTNLKADESELDTGAFVLQSGGKKAGGYTKRAASGVAKRLDAQPTDEDVTLRLAAGQTERVVWVFRIAEDVEDLDFQHENTVLSIEDVLSRESDVRDLPPMAPAIEFQEVEVDAAFDGASLSGYLPETDETVTIELLGVDAPAEDECFGEESAELLEEMAGTTVYLEAPTSESGTPDSPVDSTEPATRDDSGDEEGLLRRFVWVETDGTKSLLNQALLLAGGAGLGDLDGDTRYEEWLKASEQTATNEGAGLWAECEGPHGDPLPTPTPVPPTATATPEPEAGTRENPIPIGEAVDLGNDFNFRVVEVIPDAYQIILAENQFNDPPDEGKQFFIAAVEITYTGSASSESGGGYNTRAVGETGKSYNSGFECGVIPNEVANTELFEGGTLAGNLCWEIDSADADSMTLYIGDGSDRIYFALYQ